MQYDEPILNETLVVVCRAPILKTAKPNWPEDYVGLTIGMNSGFSIDGERFRQLVSSKKIKMDEVKGTKRNLLKLISGRTDCYVNDVISIQWELKQLKQSGEYSGEDVQRGATISSEQGYLGIITDENHYPYKQDFKRQYLSLLREMKRSGEIDNIVAEFIEP